MSLLRRSSKDSRPSRFITHPRAANRSPDYALRQIDAAVAEAEARPIPPLEAYLEVAK